MNNFILSLSLLLVALLAACTTSRPLTAQEVREQRLRDTLRFQSTVINTAKEYVPVYLHDTLQIERLTKVENTISTLDTTLLARYLDRYDGQAAEQLLELQSTILALEKSVARGKLGDSQRVVLLSKLGNTQARERQARETIATNNKIIYEVPKYIYLVLLTIAILVFLVYQYLKYRLEKRISGLKKLNSI